MPPSTRKKSVSTRSRKTLAENDDNADSGPMSAIKQATLINYHLAIEDSVDIDKIWVDMQHLFDDEEQEDIQTQGNKKKEMKKLLDLLPNKEDDAFDVLVGALRPEYKWLSLRLQQGVRDEEQRVNKLGKGIRRKIALALLTARISERQKDGILDRVTTVVETEMTHNCNRVSIPDHRALAQLDSEHKMLQKLIRDEVDPLLYGDDRKSTKTDDDNEEEDGTLELLKDKLEQLQVLKECYTAASIGKLTSGSLPGLLLQKIQEVQLKVKSLQKEKDDAMEETDRMLKQKQEQQAAISKLQQNNRNLEMENRALESSRQSLENSLRKSQEGQKDLVRNYKKASEENRDLKSEIQQIHDRLSNVTLRNQTLDTRNTKLTRDNLKLTTTNTTLRKEARNTGAFQMVEMKFENKRLTSDKIQLKKELQKMDVERRQLAIRSQRLLTENRNLREQKRKLMLEKKRNTDENKILKIEAKRLAIGKYSPLPPITEDSEREDPDQRSAASSAPLVTSESKRPTRRTPRSRGPSPGAAKTQTPWSKYKEDDSNKLPKSKASPRKKEDEEVDEEGKKVPGYLKSTASSKRHHYLEDEGMEDTSPRRSAAWK